MKFEELPMREYLMYALGANHAKHFEAYKEEFIKLFLQPERSKREDYAYCIICETYSREPEKGAGHYCHKCKEYDYA